MKTAQRLLAVGLSVGLTGLLGRAHAQPVHHWTFDETSGRIASDRSCAADGELIGFDNAGDEHWVDGEKNGALDLGVDGLFDNRVAVDLDAVNAPGVGFTICMWINPGEAILNLGEYQLVSTPGDAIGFTIMNFDGELRHDRVLLFWDGSLPNLHVGTTTLEPGTWYHIAITSTGVGGEKLYYVDGELELQTLFLPSQGGTEGSHPGNRDGWAGGVGLLGAIGAGARGHDSIIDDVRIYDTPLTEEEIADVMDESPPLAPTILNVSPDDGSVAHDAAAGVAFDVSANAPAATIPAAGIRLFLNGDDVSAQLDVAGTPTDREVLYEGLVVNQAYQARIEVEDSNGTLACRSFAFGTFVDQVPGLVHHFMMDETAGLVALDTASVRNGNLLGFDANDDAQWVSGICDNALDLGADATLDNYVEFDVNAVDAFDTGGFTVAMWLNPGEQILTIGEYQLLSTPGDAIGFTIMNFNGELRHDRVLLFWDGSLPNLHVGTTTLEPGTWYHIAITSTGVGGEKLYYINGELEPQTLFLPSQGGVEGNHPGNRDGWAEGIARIGAINAGVRTHDSIIDDFRIYDRALDEDEIFEVLEECDPQLCEPLTLADLSPAANEAFHDAAAGIEFEVSTPNAGFTIEASGIQLILNGDDVSSELSIGGTPTNRTVTYDGLAAETTYDVELSVTDGCSSLQRSYSFATFSTCPPDDPALVHYWALDEESGLLAVDCVGGAIGRLRNFGDDDAHWTDGVLDGALDFGADGVFDNAVETRLGAVSALDNGGFTVAMWVNPGEQILTPAEYQLLATPGDAVGLTIMNFEGERRHDRVLLFWDGSLPDLHVGTTTLEPGTWYHVAITSTGAGGDKLYYVDGELEEQALFLPSQGGTEGFHPGLRDGWDEGVAWIGAFNVGARTHDSILDEVRIYNRALDEDEIAALAGSEPGEGVGPFLRGDCNGDGGRNITDGVFLLNFLFLGGTRPKCTAACDNDSDGNVTASPTDALFLFNFLFLGGPPLAHPLDACARSTMANDIALGCADASGCE